MAKKKVKELKLTKSPKPVVLQPKALVREKKEEVPPRTKKSVIVHKKEEKLENIYQALGEVERTIQELTRIYSELPPSKHKGLGGKMKPTLKQEKVQEQIEHAQARAERLMKLIERVEEEELR